MTRRGREKGKGPFLLAFSLFLLPALAARPAAKAEEPWTVLLSGDAEGYLSPCGCTDPMQGGLRRRATALRSPEARRVVLDNGRLAGGTDRQNVLKAEAAAQGLDAVGTDAANLTASDARLGAGEVPSLVRLAKDRIVSTSFGEGPTVPVKPWREAGPFLVGGATENPGVFARELREATRTPEEAAYLLAQEAKLRGLAPILLFDGDRAAAARLARAEPALRLVTYHSAGHPPMDLGKEGECALATPGERGKTVVRLTWEGGRFVSQAVRDLGPEVANDPAAETIYRTYLRRVTDARLLERTVRDPSPGFAGSAKCGSCHTAALAIWRGSAHSHALKTLEADGHGRDPDCVSCHVTGLTKTTGFRSRAETPALTDVGCESCHGAGAPHAASPLKARLPKVGAKSCAPCHTPENSPKFDFALYWPRIRHGR